MAIQPREIKPSYDSATAPDQGANGAGATKLDQLFRTMVAIEEKLEARPRLRRKGKVPFERPLRRTDDRSLRLIRR